MQLWHAGRDGLALVAWCAFSRLQVRRARAVWRGEPDFSLPIQGAGPEVNRRNYAVFAAVVILFGAAGVLLLTYNDTGWLALGYVGAGLACVSVLCLPLLSVITACNRPLRLIPPKERAAAGSLAARAARRARKDQGQPETDHEVELHDVGPLPDDPKPFPPYYVAICSHEGCSWLSDPVDQDVPGAEQKVRRMAGEHSARVVGPVRPLG